MSIKNKLEWLYNLNRKGIKLGLNRIYEIARYLDNPQDKFFTIHIAGTNGKGSVAKIIYTVLRKSDYSVGLYTSPHLVRFNERIIVDDKMISDSNILNLMDKIKRLTEEKNIDITFFEFTTLMAFLYFKDKKVDIAVIETGMGGRLDTTNIVKPIVSVITNISFEHQEYLGNTIKKIAFEKAGIIKDNTPIVTKCSGKALDVIKSISSKKSAKLFVVDDIAHITKKESSLFFQKFNIKTQRDAYNIKTRLLGDHQLDNIATSIIALEIIKDKINFDKKYIRKGINSTVWPARLEIVKKKPLVIIDGAHNPDGFLSLRRFLVKHVNSKFRKKFLILGISSGKNKDKMIIHVMDLFDKIILCKAKYRGTETKELRAIIEKYKNIEVSEVEDVTMAVKSTLKEANENDAIIIAGSLFVAGEALPLFSHKYYKFI